MVRLPDTAGVLIHILFAYEYYTICIPCAQLFSLKMSHLEIIPPTISIILYEQIPISILANLSICKYISTHLRGAFGVHLVVFSLCIFRL